MKRWNTLREAASIILVFAELGCATDVAGPVWGTWTSAGSPYNVISEITVPDNQTLIIEPGVQVIFQGHYKFIVNGFLQAGGTTEDSILFTAANTTDGWWGIRFIDAPDSSHLTYCLIQYGRATGAHPDCRGGGIYCYNSNPVISHCQITQNSAAEGGGIDCYYSNPQISACVIAENVANIGGGIRCKNYSSPIVRNSLINFNYAEYFGGAIECNESCYLLLDSCTINENSTGGGNARGSIYLWNQSEALITHCAFSDNYNSAIYNENSDLTVRGCDFTGTTGNYSVIYSHNGNALIEACQIFENSVIGIGCQSNAASIIRNCTIRDNSSRGINCTYNQMVLIDQCLIEGNTTSSEGGGIYSYQSGTTITNCTISNNSANFSGGGIYGIGCTIRNCTINGNHSNDGGGIRLGLVTMINCVISENHATTGEGGGIYCYGGTNSITKCELWGNEAQTDGGGIYVGWNLGTVISDCHFYDNQADYGGGFSCDGANPTVEFCTFYENSGSWGGGGVYCRDGSSPIIRHCEMIGNSNSVNYGEGAGINCNYSSAATIENCTIYGNNSPANGGGIFTWSNTVSLVDCIIWNNLPNQVNGAPSVTYSNVLNGYTGIGNLNADPLFINVGQNDFRLLWDSPCIDAGNPDPQFNDPDGTRNDIGCYYVDQSHPVSVLLTPYNTPIQIPATGGNFDYQIIATNMDSLTHITNLWCDVTLPNAITYGPVLGPVLVTIGAGTSLSRLRTQTVPANAPAGVYSFNGYAVVESDTSKDTFTFVKLGTSGSHNSGWLNTGEEFEVIPPTCETVTPEITSLSPNHPNPFNPSTAISYELRAASYVSLRVYDTAGRLVETLVNGWQEAGAHEVTFDGSNLPSGVYLYQIEAGDWQASGKMLLMK